MPVHAASGVRRRPQPAWLLAGLAAVLVIGGAGVLATAKVKNGTSGADKLNGTSGPDRLSGGKGKDRINGFAGPDVLKGGRGKDVIRGGRGADRLIGGKGSDRLIGGPGRDEFNMRGGVEIASPGNDFIDARDGTPDQINCGKGRKDIARVDAAEEGVYNCEIIRAPKVEGENIG